MLGIQDLHMAHLPIPPPSAHPIGVTAHKPTKDFAVQAHEATKGHRPQPMKEARLPCAAHEYTKGCHAQPTNS